MSVKQDRTNVRTPADLERKYNFERSFAEIMGVATDARIYAEEARTVASSIAEVNDGIILKVQALDEELYGENGVCAKLALKVETDANGVLQSEIHVQGDMLTIDTENLLLTGDGTITVRAGVIGGCLIEDGVLQITDANILGTLSASKIDVSDLEAFGATIGGWTIGENSISGLYKEYDADVYAYTYRFTLSSNAVAYGSDWIRVAYQDEEAESDPVTLFSLSAKGELYATGAKIDGEITTSANGYSTSIAAGVITVDSPYTTSGEGAWQTYELLRFNTVGGFTYALTVTGYLADDLSSWVMTNLGIAKIS